MYICINVYESVCMWMCVSACVSSHTRVCAYVCMCESVCMCVCESGGGTEVDIRYPLQSLCFETVSLTKPGTQLDQT